MIEKYDKVAFATAISVLTVITSIYIFDYKPNFYEMMIFFELSYLSNKNEPI
jgi:hypothetical protein